MVRVVVHSERGLTAFEETTVRVQSEEETTVEVPSDDESISIGLIAGSIAGVLAILALAAAVGVFLYR